MIKSIVLSVVTLMLFITATSFDAPFNLSKSIKNGAELYPTYCSSCHAADGKGVPGAFPPLAKSDYLKQPSKQLIQIVLKGQSGEIRVNGQTFNGMMPGQDYLSDEQIADVLNYVKNSWGNKSPLAITPLQVKKARQ